MLLITAMNCSAVNPVGITQNKTEGTSRVLNQKDQEALRIYIEALLKKIPTTPGLAVGVVQGDAVTFLHGFGHRDLRSSLPVTPQTQFYIASTTKSFTGTAAKMLADEKIIDLDAPIKKYFPDLVLPAPLSSEHIAIRDLLTHRSGIRNDAIALRTAYTGQHDPETLLRLLANHSQVISPSFQYSNIGYIVAALAMEKAAKESWQVILQTKIFVPLGMKNTSAYFSKAKLSANFALPYASNNGTFVELPVKNDETMHAAGGIVASAEDLTKWLIFNMNEGKLNGKQIMSSTSLEEVLSPQINQSRSFYKFKRYAYGLGWNLGTYGDEKLIHCFGEFAGYRPHVSFMPEHKIGIVVLTNESSESIFLPDLIAADIYDYLLSNKRLQVDSNPKVDEILKDLQKEREAKTQQASKERGLPAPKPTSFDLNRYAGTFQNDALGEVVVSREGDTLWLMFGALRSQLIHQDADTFQADVKVPVNLRFSGTRDTGVRANTHRQEIHSKVVASLLTSGAESG
jgi:CubicO group peptidase (beta-lactamase class C family)